MSFTERITIRNITVLLMELPGMFVQIFGSQLQFKGLEVSADKLVAQFGGHVLHYTRVM